MGGGVDIQGTLKGYLNMADTKRKLENDIFAAAGIAQKYNCALTRLDYQQEAGLTYLP